jgi:hypothetical protein
VPKCANEEQVVGWLKVAGGHNMKKPVCGFCSDCIPDFQAKMIEQGRCENPEVIFKISHEEGFHGVLL